MFDFLMMGFNYDVRAVARFENEESGLVVDTCAVSDSEDLFETGVLHPDYNDGKRVIVETYETKELAQKGHENWVALMTAKDLPEKLFDVSSAGIKLLSEAFGADYSEGYEKNVKGDPML